VASLKSSPTEAVGGLTIRVKKSRWKAFRRIEELGILGVLRLRRASALLTLGSAQDDTIEDSFLIAGQEGRFHARSWR